MPAAELNKMKTEARAATVLGFAQPERFKIGERKIPPPIPANPERKPTAPPNAPLLKRKRLDF